MLMLDFDDMFMPEPNTGCLIWLGARDSKGYGRVYLGGKIWKAAHVVAYERERGPVPPGLQLDHLCQLKPCGNPAHLEPVTNRENVCRGPRIVAARAATHCRHGHAWTTENTYRHPSGSRVCRACTTEAQLRYQKRKKGMRE